MFESVDGRTDARTPVRVPSYKLTLWAFGSGELTIRLQDGSYLQYWLVYLGCFHIVAPLYTTDHVSENNFDQTKIDNRQIVVYPRKNLRDA